MRIIDIENSLTSLRFQRIFFWLFCVAAFFAYWLFNRQYVGPAYLSDEIGYLTKAAAFAGYSVDLSSSWHGGYSLMLAPMFWLLSDPLLVWQGIIFFNAVLWAVSFALLFYLLKRLFPNQSFWVIFAAVTFSAAYPAWITMSGYAFATPGFIAVFMLTLIALMKFPIGGIHFKYNVVFAILVGYLYWIHPLGLAVGIASVFVMGMLAFLYRKIDFFIVHVVVVAVMIAIYQFVVHPWLQEVMSPPGLKPSENYKGFLDVVRGLLDKQVLLVTAVVILGQVSYLLVSSFGIISFGVREAWGRLMFSAQGTVRANLTRPSSLIPSFVVLSLAGIVCMGAINFSQITLSGRLRLDHLIYGRYAEMVLLPLLGIGFVSVWTKRWFTISTGVILIASFVFFLFFDYAKEVVSVEFNQINIPSFWPLPVFPDLSLTWWFIAGATGVAMAGILGKRFLPLLAMPFFIVAIVNQENWHNNILSDYSNPTGLVHFVRQNFNQGSCIGFDMRSSAGAPQASRERRNMYSFYFYDYDFRRMTIRDWLKSCDGPFLTLHGRELAEKPGVSVIGRLESSGLFVATKKNITEKLSIPKNSVEAGGVFWDLTGRNDCLFNGCFERNAGELSRFSQVGVLVDGRLNSHGQEGFIFYGPYQFLAKGNYVIEVEGSFLDVDGATIDVVSNGGNTVHSQTSLREYPGKIGHKIIIPFVLTKPVNDVEVRLKVSSVTRISIERYIIKMKENMTDDYLFNTRCQPPVCLKQQAFTESSPSQVGVIENGQLVSDGKQGFLLFGPYQPLNAGRYRLVVLGEGTVTDTAWVDVVSKKGTVQYARFPLSSTSDVNKGVLAEGSVTLESLVKDVEVRVFVGNRDVVRLTGYNLIPENLDETRDINEQ